MSTNSLKVSERFYSIQGEGKTTGVPAYFIRLTDCNLSCGSTQKMLNTIRRGELAIDTNTNFHGDLHKQGEASWTCDSIAVWIKGGEIFFQEILKSWQSEGIYEDIKRGLCHIVWTGGEPTLVQHQKAIIQFYKWWDEKRLQDENDRTYYYNAEGQRTQLIHSGDECFEQYNEIETNGTVYINDDLFLLLDQINCSPKLSNSGMSKKKRIVSTAILRIMEHCNHQFKFVVDSEEDIKEVFEDFITPFNIPLQNVCMMPALDDQALYHERTNFICEMAKKYKFIAAQRLHISSWGAVTGV